jgi:hypothetical protein
MLVLAVMLYIETWKSGHLNLAAKILGGLMLATQAFMLVLDIWVISSNVHPYLLIIVMVINLILGILNFFLGGPPDQNGPVAEWWRTRGEPFVKALENPPSTRFDWSASPTKIKSGDSTLITVTGKWRQNSLLSRLYKLQANFNSGLNFVAGFVTTETSMLPGRNQIARLG